MIPNDKVEQYFAKIIAECREIFKNKLEDYGPTWAIYREVSLADQIWIKIKRVRTVGEVGCKVQETAEDGLRAIVNYAVIWLMRINYPELIPGPDRIIEDVSLLKSMDRAALRGGYDDTAADIVRLFRAKNHDYGSAWQEMSVASIIDMIMIRTLRVKNIVYGDVKPTASEDVDGQLADIVIYAVFALIKYGAAET